METGVLAWFVAVGVWLALVVLFWSLLYAGGERAGVERPAGRSRSERAAVESAGAGDSAADGSSDPVEATSRTESADS
jgi:hypothetical protein